MDPIAYIDQMLGMQITDLGNKTIEGRLTVRPDPLAPNGYLHAAAVVGLADTLCGYGCWANRPEGASGFTTIELKANFIGTARGATVACRATLAHGGRTTQVWDAEVMDESGKVIALFRCTQLVLYPR